MSDDDETASGERPHRSVFGRLDLKTFQCVSFLTANQEPEIKKKD